MHEYLKTEPLNEPEIPRYPMKVAATLIIPALAISFAVPAQQKDAVDLFNYIP